MKKLNVLIDRLIDPMGYRFGVLETKLKIAWSDILHKPLSDYSTPSKVLFDKYTKESTLYINVSNGSVAMEIRYLIPTLIESIAVFLGYKGVHNIKIKQFY